MDTQLGINWETLFAFTLSPLEIIVRGSVFFWFLFLIFRFIVRRDIGAVGLADILILVIVADASQNAIAGEYKSLGDGMLLVLVLVGWNVILDWAAYRFRWFRRFAEPSALRLVQDGRILWDNLRKESITEDELWSKLRQNGIQSLAQLKSVRLEPDGQFSIVRREE